MAAAAGRNRTTRDGDTSRGIHAGLQPWQMKSLMTLVVTDEQRKTYHKAVCIAMSLTKQ